MIAFNSSKNKVIANQVRVAKNIFQRFRGLLGTSELKEGEGLFIPKCQGVHTFGMAYPIDVIFLDGNEEIIHCIDSLQPNCASPVFLSARGVLELPAGSAQKKSLTAGDRLSFLSQQ